MTTKTIAARHRGHCIECGCPVIPGERIARLNRATWGHAACADSAARRIAADDLDALTYGFGMGC